MNVLKSIIEKLRIKEIFAILFIAALIITFLPLRLANILKVKDFREMYQTYISMCIIIPGAFYILEIFTCLKKAVKRKFHNREKIAIKYMKQHMSADEMYFLIEKYYDKRNHLFQVSAMVDITEGRKAPLEYKNIIYRASNAGYLASFAYNLQPYALEFLNKNLKEGNIKITQEGYSWNLN